jgi:hypothetical protein
MFRFVLLNGGGKPDVRQPGLLRRILLRAQLMLKANLAFSALGKHKIMGYSETI